MFCPHCGKENIDDAQFCVQCGNSLASAAQPSTSQQQTAGTPVPPPAPGQQQQQAYQQPYVSEQPQPVYAQATTYPMTSQDETLRLINFILCILSCIALCWAVIPPAVDDPHDRSQLGHLQGHQAQHYHLRRMHADLRKRYRRYPAFGFQQGQVTSRRPCGQRKAYETQ